MIALTMPKAGEDYTARWCSPGEAAGDGVTFAMCRGFGLVEIIDGCGVVVFDEWAADAERAQDFVDSFDFADLEPEEKRDFG